MKEIVILDSATVNPGDLSWGILDDLAELRIYERTNEDDVLNRIENAEIILTNKTIISRNTIINSSVKFIGVFATGYNVVDIEAAKEKGVLVANIPAYSTDAVAQYTFALLFTLCHRVQKHSDMVHEGAWTKSKDFSFWAYPQIELTNKYFGIIGFGNIGQQVARIALALNTKVLVYTRTPKPELKQDGLEFVDFDSLLSISDVISINCPLTENTQDLINEPVLNKMKSNAFIINTSRGPIVHEKDMRNALEKELIGGYATDVASIEPIPADNPLLNAPNCIITPHIAWAPKETRQRLLTRMGDNIKAYLEDSPINIVS